MEADVGSSGRMRNVLGRLKKWHFCEEFKDSKDLSLYREHLSKVGKTMSNTFKRRWAKRLDRINNTNVPFIACEYLTPPLLKCLPKLFRAKAICPLWLLAVHIPLCMYPWFVCIDYLTDVWYLQFNPSSEWQRERKTIQPTRPEYRSLVIHRLARETHRIKSLEVQTDINKKI